MLVKRLILSEHDDYGSGPVVEFALLDDPDITFLALDLRDWKALGEPEVVTITVE